MYVCMYVRSHFGSRPSVPAVTLSLTMEPAAALGKLGCFVSNAINQFSLALGRHVRTIHDGVMFERKGKPLQKKLVKQLTDVGHAYKILRHLGDFHLQDVMQCLGMALGDSSAATPTATATSSAPSSSPRHSDEYDKGEKDSSASHSPSHPPLCIDLVERSNAACFDIFSET